MLRGMVFIGTSKLTKVLVVCGTVGIALSAGRIFSEDAQNPENRKPSDREGFRKLIPTEFPHFNVTGIFMELDLHS